MSSEKVRRIGRSSPLKSESFRATSALQGLGSPGPDTLPNGFSRENRRPPRVPRNMEMAWRGPPQVWLRGCLGTGTAHRGAPGPFSSTGCRSGSPQAGEPNYRGLEGWCQSRRLLPASLPPLAPAGSTVFFADFVFNKIRGFSFAELGFRWPVVSWVSGVLPAWGGGGRPAGQMEVWAFRKCLGG